MSRQSTTRALGLGLASTLVGAALLSPFAEQARAWQATAKKAAPKVGYTDTPLQPYGTWRVHDGTRPQPKVVEPATPSTQETPGRAPSDAIVLFDGKDLAKWEAGGGKPAKATVEGGAIVIGGGSISTREAFGDCQLHIEWAAPTPPKGRDQGRGNSGVMMFGRYEIQVLDCYDNVTYADGYAGAIYGQYPPLVNACRKPGEWQTYDMVFHGPVFAKDGKVETPAYLTLFHNGVLVQDHQALLGSVAFKALAKYEQHGPKGAITLQDHGNPVRFRNIWLRELKGRGQD